MPRIMYFSHIQLYPCDHRNISTKKTEQATMVTPTICNNISIIIVTFHAMFDCLHFHPPLPEKRKDSAPIHDEVGSNKY